MCVCVCVCVCGCVCVQSCWVEWGHPLFRLKRYHLPNLRLTLINLRLCNSNLWRQFFLTSEACTVAIDVVFPVWSALLRLHEDKFSHTYLPQKSQQLHLFSCRFFFFFSKQNNYTSPGHQVTNASINLSLLFCFVLIFCCLH